MTNNIFYIKNIKSIYILFTLIAFISFSGCGKNGADNNFSTESDQETKTAQSIMVENNISENDEDANGSEPSDNSENSENNDVAAVSSSYTPEFSTPYRFYDVFRNEYEMDLNSNVSPNPYSPDCYTYFDSDLSGNKMAESSDPYICNTKPDSTPDIQMQGYSGIIKYDDDTYTSRFGIDVSKFQGNIDWEKVKSAGVDFAFVRVGFRGYGKAGELKEDAYYRKNIEGAQAAGIDVGVYFYAQAINEEEASEEADFVLNLIDCYNLELPVVYDPEHVLNDTARTDNVTGEQFTKNARAFSDRILSSGNTPMIYANMMWEAFELDLSMLKDVEIWFADYENKPQSPYKFAMWQYSQNGKISGISGPVDLNIMYVSKTH